MSDGVRFLDLPPWSQMNFSRNCTVWRDWMSVIATPIATNPEDSVGPSIPQGIELFAAAAPANLSLPANKTEGEFYATIAEWYTYNIFYTWDAAAGQWNQTPDFYQRVLIEPMAACPDEYCEAVAYIGNADLTGIGVFLSYIVEAILVTAYLVAFTYWHLRRHVRRRRRERYGTLLEEKLETGPAETAPSPPPSARTSLRARWSRLSLAHRALDAFRGSLDGFLSTAILMSLAMLSAALYLDSQGIRSHKSGAIALPFHSSAAYDMILSMLASCFSVFPVLLLYALKGRRDSIVPIGSTTTGRLPRADDAAPASADDRHHRWMRRLLVFAIWVLAAVEVYLSPRGNVDYAERHDPARDDANYDPCNKRGGTGYWRSMRAAQWLVLALPLLWIVLTAFVVTGFGIPGLVDRPWVRRWRAVWRLAIAWVNLVVMWVILAYFVVLRSRIVATSGPADPENTWGFGQVLALATWVPIVAEFVYIFIWGLEESLDSHLPSGFTAQRQRTTSSGLGFLSRTTFAEPDPYEMVEDPEPGLDTKTHTWTTASSSEAPHPDTPFGPGHRGGSLTDANQDGQVSRVQISPTHAPNPEETRAYHQTPWQQWESTGW